MLKGGRPHWELKFPSEVWPVFEEFRNFVCVVWDVLGLPEPTRAQLEMAHRLQYGVDSTEWEAGIRPGEGASKDIIRCLRGLGKSYITAAFAIWRLMRNPRDEKILVVSASSTKAKQFVSQVTGIISVMEITKWLVDGPREGGAARRNKSDEFDVQFASIAQSCSVIARGVEGQITGQRATLIIPDDIEVKDNSRTVEARERLLQTVREFSNVGTTEHGIADIKVLGTPQSEESIYNFMVQEMSYTCFCIPARYPSDEKRLGYVLKTEGGVQVDILAHYLKMLHANEELTSGDPTDPGRFSESDLREFEAQGKSNFALQYMLDTTLSDAERYPLRQADLIVMSVPRDKAPINVEWGKDTDNKNLRPDLANHGFSTDFWLGPLFADSEWRAYDASVLFVDPSGRGKDETAWAIVKSLNGNMFVSKIGGFNGDPDGAMKKIAYDAKLHNVQSVIIEPNYGQGVWITAFNPILQKVWAGGCTVEEAEWAKGRKEIRTIDTLEPVMTGHRLIVDESVARGGDLFGPGSTYSGDYNAMYQLTHITRDAGSLKHDDRVDCLAGAVNYLMDHLSLDPEKAAKEQLEAEHWQQWEDWQERAAEGQLVVGRYVDGYVEEVEEWSF